MAGTIATEVESDWMLAGQTDEQGAIWQARIDCSPFRVGRRSDLQLTIALPAVSKLHAEFRIEGDSLRLRDLGSTNGTYVNGKRIVDERIIEDGDLVQFATVVFRATREVPQVTKTTISDDPADRALALIQFDRLMADRAVVPYFQPLVNLESMEAIGYEVLGRSRLFGLSQPSAMFRAAALLDLEAELSRMFRTEGVRVGRELLDEYNLFLNTRPLELDELELLGHSLQELREIKPEGALTLEIHESAVTNPAQMHDLRVRLEELNMRLAYDDFGAGQARFLELTEVPPDYLKFDVSLIRGIHQATAQRQRMLENLVRMAKDLGISPMAEGVEEPEEHSVCRQIGFDLGQGFLYGKPAAAKTFRAPATN